MAFVYKIFTLQSEHGDITLTYLYYSSVQFNPFSLSTVMADAGVESFALTRDFSRYVSAPNVFFLSDLDREQSPFFIQEIVENRVLRDERAHEK